MRSGFRVAKSLLSVAGISVAAMAAVCAAYAAGGNRQSSPEDARALVLRAIASQHKNDEAIAELERRERRQVFKHIGEQPAEDKMYRVVPTGTGTLRLLVEEGGREVSPELYRRQLRDLEQALNWALAPEESKQKQRVDKFNRRSRERAELVDSVAQAFRFTWQGRQSVDGRTLAKIGFEPEPSFKPRAKNSDLFQHVSGTLWIEESSAQLARIEAQVIRDISVFGGVFGKIYKGGHFVMVQEPFAGGPEASGWLPVRYEYHFSGRRFVFGFELHEVTTASAYRRIGPPKEALVAVRQELSTNGNAPAAKE
jgi:hypothetical protein